MFIHSTRSPGLIVHSFDEELYKIKKKEQRIEQMFVMKTNQQCYKRQELVIVQINNTIRSMFKVESRNARLRLTGLLVIES